jgi:hypothetical protein
MENTWFSPRIGYTCLMINTDLGRWIGRGPQKVLIAGSGVVLAAFVAYGVYTWVRVIEVIPGSSSCATTLFQISQRSAMVRPFFLGAFAIGAAVFELSRRQLPGGWRIAYLVILGLATALIVAPWLVGLVYP